MAKMTGDRFYRKTANAIAAYLYQELKIKPGVHYRLRSAVSGPRVLPLALLLNPRYAGKMMTMSEQLSMTAGLDRDQSLRIGRGSGGTLILEIPKLRSLWYNVPLTALPRHRGIKAMLGLDGEHRPNSNLAGDTDLSGHRSQRRVVAGRLYNPGSRHCHHDRALVAAAYCGRDCGRD
jgi:hypothetical protein